MADGIDQAAAAFDAVLNTEAGKSPAKGKAPSSGEGPTDSVFRSVGELDPDTEAKGGGDDEDLEDPIYGDIKPKVGPRDAGKKEGASDEDGEDPDADGADGDDDGDDTKRDKDDSEEEDEDAEGDDAASEAVLAQEVEVTVDGDPVKVTVKEALEGYVRTETFHRRMNQLDDAKKIVRRAAADAVQNYEYSMNVARQMEAHMEQMIPKEPDWDEEFKKDPVKARELQRYYEKANGFKAQLKEQLAEAVKKKTESEHAQLAAFAEEENLKFEAANRKYWTDPKRKAKDLQSMRKTGLTAGFSEEELSQVYDSRMLTVLLKASKYDRMMAAKPKPVIRPTGKPIPPGAGSAKSRTAQSGVTSAMKRLNRTGKIEDAAVVFDQLIAKG